MRRRCSGRRVRIVPLVIADLRTQRARDPADDSTLDIDSSPSETRPKTTHVRAAVCPVSLGSHAVSSNSPVRFLHPRHPPTSSPATGSPERSRPDCDPALRRARQLSVHSVLHPQAGNTRRLEYPSRSSSQPETLHAAASTSTGARGSLSLAHLHNRARSEYHLGFPPHRGRAIAPVACRVFPPAVAPSTLLRCRHSTTKVLLLAPIQVHQIHSRHRPVGTPCHHSPPPRPARRIIPGMR